MSNPLAIPPTALPDIKQMIRPEHIRNISKFPGDSKEKYVNGVADLWNVIENHAPNSEEYRKAHLKLFEVTKSVKTTMAKANLTAAAQSNVRPTSSGQPVQQELRPPVLNTQNGGQPQAQEAFSQRVIEEVRKLTFVAPTHLNNNEATTKQWIRDAQRKYAEMLQRLESASKRLTQLHSVANLRTSQGKPLNQQESENYQLQVTRLESQQKEHRQALQTFQSQQENYKAQQALNQASMGAKTASNAGQALNATAQNTNTVTGGFVPQVKQEPQSQPHTLSSAVDAARNQASSVARSAMSPHSSGQPSQPPMNQVPMSRPQLNPNSVSHSHPPLNINTTSGPQNQQNNSPRVAPSQPSTMPHEPVPLSHSAAVDAARSYAHPNMSQQTPQSASASDQRNQNNHAKMPIPKDLNLAPIQPVSMGPSRPTLTNGPIAMGPMGQPAIQRHPGYVLEGEGERVLSKKKLEELVRQVTGGTGGEGEESEGLNAEVEEVCVLERNVLLVMLFTKLFRLSYRSPMNSSTKSWWPPVD